MNHPKIALLFFILILVQAFLFYVPFHCKFTSILVDNVPTTPTTTTTTTTSPAKRVVVISIDGNRADWFFKSILTGHHPRAKKVLHDEFGACWGVAHTRAPTESRPGHTAMMAGFFEDPACVHTLWSEAIKPFDSVINQSPIGYQTGQYNIIGMLHRPHILTVQIPKKPTQWDYADPIVGTNFEQFVKGTAHAEFKEKLRTTRGAVLFLHLPSMDSVAHGDPWGTPGYFNAVARAEKSIDTILTLVPQFFGDNDTAFVIAGDHGMSNHSTPHHKHGTDHPDELHTGLLVWGAGVRNCSRNPPTRNRVLHTSEEMYAEQQEVTMRGMNMSRRQDIDQIDIAPMVSVLAGNPIPVNSRGVLNVNYLDPNADTAFIRNGLVVNMKQLKTLVDTAASDVWQRQLFPALTFRPYYNSAVPNVIGSVNEMARCVDHGDLDGAQRRADALGVHFRDALRYYQTYDWFMLFALTALCYLMIALLGITLSARGLPTSIILTIHRSAASVFFLTLMCTSAALGKPMIAYVLSFIASLLVGIVVGNASTVRAALTTCFGGGRGSTWAGVCIVIVLLHLGVVGYVHRESFAYAIALICIHRIITDVVFKQQQQQQQQPSSHLRIVAMCVTTATISLFFSLPIKYRSRILPPAAALLFALLCFVMTMTKKTSSLKERCVAILLTELQLLAMFLIWKFDGIRSGDPPAHRISARASLVTISIISVVIALDAARTSHAAHFMFALAVPFTISCSGFESLFVLTMGLFAWLWAPLSAATEGLGQAVTAAQTLILVLASFFGHSLLERVDASTGTRLFESTDGVNNYVFAGKIIFSVLVVVVIHHQQHQQASVVILTAASLAEVMCIPLFLVIASEGSWGVMGASLTRSGVACGVPVVLVALLGVVNSLLVENINPRQHKPHILDLQNV
eukprot:PhM_4_TR5978/c0_g1_i2/m.58638/K05285/PIGN; phosphatidylinositol glycan, class N